MATKKQEAEFIASQKINYAQQILSEISGAQLHELSPKIMRKIIDSRHMLMQASNALNACPFCGVSPTSGCPTCEQAGRIKAGA